MLSLVLLSFYVCTHLKARMGGVEIATVTYAVLTEVRSIFHLKRLDFDTDTRHKVMNYFYKIRAVLCLPGFSVGQSCHFV